MLANVTLRIVQLPHASGLPLPCYATLGSSGLDLTAAISSPIIINPGKRKLIPTGVIIELPNGYEGQIRPRSGLAWKQGLTVLNTPGTVDSDYRGEISIVLINLGQDVVEITRGMRIAQMIIAPVIQSNIVLANNDLSTTSRGSGGFGSTGTSS